MIISCLQIILEFTGSRKIYDCSYCSLSDFTILKLLPYITVQYLCPVSLELSNPIQPCQVKILQLSFVTIKV